MQHRLIQQAAGPAGHGHSPAVGPAIPRPHDMHPVQSEVPHRTGRGPDVFTHLRADKDKGWLGGSAGHECLRKGWRVIRQRAAVSKRLWGHLRDGQTRKSPV